jgi:hypothetical protein
VIKELKILVRQCYHKPSGGQISISLAMIQVITVSHIGSVFFSALSFFISF